VAREKLKVGLLVDSYQIPTWFFRSLEWIKNSDFAQVSLVILAAKNKPDSPSRSSHPNLVYRFLNAIDQKYVMRRPDALCLVDLRVLFPDVPDLTIQPAQQGDLLDFSSYDFQQAQTADLDLIASPQIHHFSKGALNAARYGFWCYNFPSGSRRMLTGFWQTVLLKPTTEATLLMFTLDFPGGQTIDQAQCMTYPFSPARNRNTLLWTASSFLPRQIKRLKESSLIEFKHGSVRFATNPTLRETPAFPSNARAIAGYIQVLARQFVELVNRAFNLDTWYLMFDKSGTNSFNLSNYQKILPPKDRFWADPHVIERNGSNFIFVEEYPYRERKGRIAVIETDHLGKVKPPVPVLSLPYHLSYPFVFEQDGRLFMIPETAANRTIDLYECTGFPDRWEFRLSLLQGIRAKDTTVFYYQWKWWLFTGVTENLEAHPESELFLFYADELLTTNWHSHPLNPVISDVTRARPAGRLFEQDGKLIRPSQNGAGMYGSGFNLNEVLCLNETEYVEKVMIQVKPDWGPHTIGTHTFTRSGAFTVIDVLTRRSKFF